MKVLVSGEALAECGRSFMATPLPEAANKRRYREHLGRREDA